MHSTKAWRERVRLDSVFALADQVPADQTELRSHLARYLCVLISGYIEVGVAAILTEYASSRGDRRLASYAESQLEWFTNPNRAKLSGLLAEFDVDWRNRLERALTTEQDAALTSIYSIRNLVAHGRSTDVTISRARSHAKFVYEVVDFVDELCYSSPRA